MTTAEATPATLSTNLFSYLLSLPPHVLISLYSDGNRGLYACRAALQHLPPIARQYALRLAACGGKLELEHCLKWCNTKYGNKHFSVVEAMERLCVIVPHNTTDVISTVSAADDTSTSAAAAVVNINNKAQQVLQLTLQFQEGIKKSISSLQSAPWPAVDMNRLYESTLQKTQVATTTTTTSSNSGTVPKKLKLNLTKSSAPTIIMSKHPQKPNMEKPPSANDLEIYTQRRWDSVLHYLVGSTDYAEEPPKAVTNFLEKTGLMQKDVSTTDNSLVITSKGYEFMLQDVHVQVWLFILQYLNQLESIKRCEEVRHEALLFLICLSYCQVGEAYPCSKLSRDGYKLCTDFSQFGLVKLYNVMGKNGDLKNRDNVFFYPTRVAVNLIAGSTAAVAHVGAPSISSTRALEESISAPVPGTSHLAIIVQTNFQLCAYTTSELHVSMLGLFCEESTFRRLPNVVFFKISRDSVKGAFRFGIEAGQILQFLKMNAHPRLRSEGQLIPLNIEDQILLWDRERHRVQMEEVFLLQCQDANEFQVVIQYAIDLGAHMWSNEHKNTIMVRYTQTESVMAYVQKCRARAAKKRRRGDIY